MYGGFVDLRAHGHGDTPGADNTFWPSFTDIMTVVVMIFLLTSVIVIVRNWDLVDSLRASILAEQQATETVRATTKARETAEQQLANAQQRMTALRTRFDKLSTNAARNAELVSAKARSLMSARSAIKQLSGNLQASHHQVGSLRARIEQTRSKQAELKESLGNRQKHLHAAQSRVVQLTHKLKSSGSRVSVLEQQIEQANAQQAELQKSFASRQTDLQSAQSRITQLIQNLESSEQRASSLEEQIERARTERVKLQKSFASRQTDLSSANARIEVLAQALNASSQKVRSLGQQMQQTKNEKSDLRTAYDLQHASLSSVRNKAAQLATALSAQIRELRELRQERTRIRRQSAQVEQELANLRGNYDTLQVKYNELVQPARSPQGKHVVEVRYDKGPQGYRIGFREPGDEDFRTITRAELERRLDKIKARRADNLYVRIIIPDTSDLSYNEAWTFTNEILSRYDYYYQTPGRAPDAESVQ